MTLTPEEADAAIKDFFLTNVPLATYIKGLRNCDPERVDAIGNLLHGRFYGNSRLDELVPPQFDPPDRRCWRFRDMNMHGNSLAITERQVRTAQAHLLSGQLTNDSRRIIDKIISHFCQHVPPGVI